MLQKTTWTLLLIIGLLSSFLFQSCGKGDVEYINIKNYNYTNQTNYVITISKWLNNVENKYEISKSGKINFRMEFNGGGCFIDNVNQTAFNPNSSCLLIIADSIKIVFDNNKKLTLKQGDKRDINILNESNYNFNKAGNIENFNYVFTQKDYLEAK